MAALSGKRVVIIHGWSDNWRSMRRAGEPLEAAGARVHYADYDSREDRAVYEDFAEGLHQNLAAHGLLKGGDRSLHFVTHSTGALVLRQWLRQYPAHNALAGNVVFLAPPHFGSPLATMGNSFLGKLFKGQHGTGGDDFEVGEKILHGLELASPLAWELAGHDLFGPKGALYHAGGVRASVITGNQGYGGLRYLLNQPGTDGTIVVAGANLNARRIALYFDREGRERWMRWRWSGFGLDERPRAGVRPANLPFAIHSGLDHASILALEKSPALLGQVRACLAGGPADYRTLRKDFARFTDGETANSPERNFQQFVFRVVDERGNPVRDYHLEFNVWRAGRLRESYPGGPRHVPDGTRMTKEEEALSGELDRRLAENLHVHSQDPSFHRYLLSPREITEKIAPPGSGRVITIRVDAASGDRDITYDTKSVGNLLFYHSAPDFPVRIRPFFENTTTLVEMHINRESRLVKFRP